MSDNRTWTGEENGAFAVLSEAHVILDSIVGKDARPIAARLADVAADRARISALEAENAALRTGDAMLKAALKDADEQNAALKAERDAARAWAAAWRASAHVWRREMMVPRTLTFHANLGMVSAERRARRAAEAMERR